MHAMRKSREMPDTLRDLKPRKCKRGQVKSYCNEIVTKDI